MSRRGTVQLRFTAAVELPPFVVDGRRRRRVRHAERRKSVGAVSGRRISGQRRLRIAGAGGRRAGRVDRRRRVVAGGIGGAERVQVCLLYTSDAADEEDSVDLIEGLNCWNML